MVVLKGIIIGQMFILRTLSQVKVMLSYTSVRITNKNQ